MGFPLKSGTRQDVHFTTLVFNMELKVQANAKRQEKGRHTYEVERCKTRNFNL
jgi:hypothetical protein